MNKTIYIYKTTFTDNNGNQKIYIGKRTLQYETPATENYFGSGKNIVELLQNYSKDHFKKEIIKTFVGEYSEIENDVENLERQEIKKALKKYGDDCINCRICSAGVQLSDLTREHIRQSKKGHPTSQETKDKISRSMTGNHNAARKQTPKQEHKQILDSIFDCQ